MHKQAITDACTEWDTAQGGYGMPTSLSGTYSLLPQTTNSLWYLYMVTMASVSDPRPLTLVSVTTKHTSLHWACNRHSPLVELPNTTGQTGKTESGDPFLFVRVYYLTTEEWKEFLPGSSLSHLDH